MKATLRCALALAALLLCACEKKDEAPAHETPSPAASPVETSAEAPKQVAAVVDLSQVPVEEDFEDEAEKEITPANLEQQLDAMEKELQAE